MAYETLFPRNLERKSGTTYLFLPFNEVLSYITSRFLSPVPGGGDFCLRGSERFFCFRPNPEATYSLTGRVQKTTYQGNQQSGNRPLNA